MLIQACILRGPQTKKDKIRNGCLSPAFWGPERSRKCYVTPAFSGIAKQKKTTSEVAASPLPSRGPKRGQKCYVTLHS